MGMYKVSVDEIHSYMWQLVLEDTRKDILE